MTCNISGYEVNRKSSDKNEKLQFSLLKLTSPSECRKFGASRKKEELFDDQQSKFDFSQIVTSEDGKLYCVTAKKKELCKGAIENSKFIQIECKILLYERIQVVTRAR